MVLNRRKGLRTFLKLLLGVVAIFIILSISLLWGGNKEIPAVRDSFYIFEKVRDVAITGGKLTLNKDDLNSLIKFVLPKGIKDKNSEIKGAYTDIKSGEIVLYIPVRYKKISFLLCSKNKVAFRNNRIIISPSDIKIGLVPIPKGFAIGLIKNYSTKDIVIAENDIQINIGKLPIETNSIKVVGDRLEVAIKKLKLFGISENLYRKE